MRWRWRPGKERRRAGEIMRPGVRLGEVFVECAENTEFPGFGFLRQAKIAPRGGENGSRRGKTEPEGSKEGDWMYTGAMWVPKWKSRLVHLRLRSDIDNCHHDLHIAVGRLGQ